VPLSVKYGGTVIPLPLWLANSVADATDVMPTAAEAKHPSNGWSNAA
jgi:hypothetical protein